MVHLEVSHPGWPTMKANVWPTASGARSSGRNRKSATLPLGSARAPWRPWLRAAPRSPARSVRSVAPLGGPARHGDPSIEHDAGNPPLDRRRSRSRLAPPRTQDEEGPGRRGSRQWTPTGRASPCARRRRPTAITAGWWRRRRCRRRCGPASPGSPYVPVRHDRGLSSPPDWMVWVTVDRANMKGPNCSSASMTPQQARGDLSRSPPIVASPHAPRPRQQ
jgi:hypothetical protein